MSCDYHLSCTRHRTQHNLHANGARFLDPPSHAAGIRVDLSDRMLLCASSNLRNEVIVGGSDHALYAVDIVDPSKYNNGSYKPVTMYSKTCGHTDWVTTVTHLTDGKVLSGSMDGKLCLWSEYNRSQCIELQSPHSSHPISKVVSDTRNNVAMSCSYDGRISVWKFSSDNDDIHMKDDEALVHAHSRVAKRSSTDIRSQTLHTIPLTYLSAHTEPVLDCGYHNDVLVSGDKSGSMIIWDLATCTAKHKFRAHPGAITAVDCLDDRGTVVSAGTDGYVKVWDPRIQGSGLVAKLPSHILPASGTAVPPPISQRSLQTGRTSSTLNTSGRISSTTGRGRSSGGRGTGRGPQSSGQDERSTTRVVSSAISTLGVVRGRGSSGDVSYIITGSGSPEDSSIAVMDVRNSFQPISRWSHQRNGVYSLCIVGEESVFSGDGAGTLLCHSLLTHELDDPRACLKYGIGASEQGAVRSISCINGKLVTAGEDGKVMVFDYNSLK